MRAMLRLPLLAAAIVWLCLGASAMAAQVLHRGNQNEPDTLDPHRATGSWESSIISDMFVGLMTDGPDGLPIYGAAESHTISPDGLVATFTIRKDHVWSDGVPVTADDFVYGMRRILDPKSAAEFASFLYPIKNAAEVNSGKVPVEELGVRAVDARTLEITLAHPAPYLPALLAHYTSYGVPKHVIEKFGADWTNPGNLVSNGPYMLAAWVPNDHVKIVKNPLFFDAANVKIDEVYFFPTDDLESALKRFRAGEIDTNNGIPSQKLEYVRSELGSEVRIAPFMNLRYITMNNLRAPFNDMRVRKALSLAIDRETITGKILKAGEAPAYAMVPPGVAGYAGGPQIAFKDVPYAQRVEEAKALLAQAGFGPENPLSFSFNYIADPDSKRVAVALAGMWQSVGVKAELLVSEKKVHYDTVREGNYEVGEANWIADYNDAKNFLFLTQPSSGKMNMSKYANLEFEALMAQADQTIDPVARAALMAQAEKMMLDEYPVAPVYYGVSRSLVKTYVKGWVDNVANIHRTRFLSIDRGTASQ